jgi:hypothetical protein
MSIPSLTSVDPVTVCTTWDEKANSVPITRLPDASWGGRRAVVVEASDYGQRQLWCVATPHGYVQAMALYSPGTGTDEEIHAAMAAIAASWTWK